MEQSLVSSGGKENNSKELCLLSLDGGGVRGLSSLLVLKQLMESLDPIKPPKPCEYFDMIAGTSTGGLIAIMLGRLQMSVDECINEYKKLSSKVFTKVRHRLDYTLGIQGRFDHSALEDSIRSLLEARSMDPEALFAESEDTAVCKTFVCATSTFSSETTILSSYYSPRRGNDLRDVAKIWEVGRATSAASTFFSPIKFGDESFMDGATGANNPIFQLWQEATDIYSEGLGWKLENNLRCLVSIGTGQLLLTSFSNSLKEVGTSLVAIATNSGQIADNFQKHYSHLFEDKKAFRYNVAQGLENIGLEEANKIGNIQQATRRYVQSEEVYTSLRACAAQLRSHGKVEGKYSPQKREINSFELDENMATRSIAGFEDYNSDTSHQGKLRRVVKLEPQAYSHTETRFHPVKFTEQPQVVNLNNESHRSMLTRQKKLFSADNLGIVSTLPCFDTLPPPANHFFGRERYLEKIHEKLAPSAAVLQSIAIHGLGGVGKTQIALAYAHKHKFLKTYDAILWVNSETDLSLASSFTTIAIILGISIPGSHTDAENRVLVLSQLQKITSWLLIFDNAEDPRLLQEFWPSTSHGSVLVTSRNHILALTTSSDGLEIETFGEKEGAEFLLSRFKAEQREIPGESKAALELVQKLGGHALGINQMAALIIHRGLTIAEFMSSYDKRTKEIHREHRLGQRSSGYLHYLDTVWKMSFGLLSEEQHASSFTMLGVLSLMASDLIPQDLFKHNENLPDSLDFCEDAYSLSGPMELLFSLSLIKKSVQESSGLSMLSLHRLVQTEFGYYIKPPAQQEMFTNASLLLSNAFPKQLNGRPMRKVWDRCALYISHVIALAQSYDSSSGIVPSKEFCWLVSYAAWYLKEYGSISQARFLVNVGFKAYEACVEKDRHIHLHLSNTIAVVNLERGNFQEAWEYLKTCEKAILEIFGPDHEETSSNYNNLGLCCINLGKYDEALRYLQLAEQIIQQDPTATPEEKMENVAGAVLVVGIARWVLGDCVAAVQCCEEALSYFETAEAEWYLCACTHFLYGGLHRTNLEIEKAKISYDKAKKLLNEHNAHIHPLMAHILYKLGSVEVDRKDYITAINYLREALSIADLLTLSAGEKSRILKMLANALSQHGGEEKEAMETRAHAIRLRKEVQKTYDESDQSERAYDMLVSSIFW